MTIEMVHLENILVRLGGALLVSLTACASEGSEAAERQADTAARRDSIAAVAAASMGEENVLSLLEQTHAADSAVGVLGAQKGTTSEVKEFGRMIFREHRALRRDALSLAEKMGIAPQPPRVPPDEPPSAMREIVEGDSAGLGWDRAYLDYAIRVHQSAMENTARALAATRRPEVKQFIEKSVPILQKHLDKARSLRKTVPRQ
jgi:putative membrane protein